MYRLSADARDDARTEELLQALRRLDIVEYAERDSIISVCAEPNDTLYASQWALGRIDAAEAWDIYRDASSVVVAVPDTGVDYHHRDLQGSLWFNEAELDGVPGVDDDGNGYVDDIRGYDFIANDSDPLDDHGHGTHCVGIIAARTDNGLDVAGVCWNARVMVLKMLDHEGYGTASQAIEALYYAVAGGAQVISCSWGEEIDSQAVQEAVAYARYQGVVVLAAAGNDASSMPYYPAAYPEVIGVAGTDKTDGRQYASNFGDWVDVAAPGDGIFSLRAAGTSVGAAWNAFTTRLSGTSMATPHVAGACALLLSANPLLGPDELRHKVLDTGDPIAEGICSSNRRLNLAAALDAAVPRRGEVGFDREAYTEGSDIAVHLVDRHLKGTGMQVLLVTTAGGDAELVTLIETGSALGVFSTLLSSEAGGPIPGDGRIQALDGEWIAVEYVDADDGQGQTNRTVTSHALADYAAPEVVNIEIEARGTSARVTVATDEPAEATLHYVRVGQAGIDGSLQDRSFRQQHRLSFGPLARESDYEITLTLTDAAGNETVVDSDVSGQALSVRVDPAALLVPGMYRTIQAAVDAAKPGQTIWVADGTRSNNGNRAIDLKGKAIALRSENGPAACTINGRGRNYGFVFKNGEGAETILEGFTISNGGDVDFGGGIQCLSSNPTIVNCILAGNQADRYGGGLYCLASSPTVEDCTFVGNGAGERGGAVYCDIGSAPRLRRCLFYDNVAVWHGGAIGGSAAAVTLANCTIARNDAGKAGGGLWCDESGSLRLDNCIVWGNTDASPAAPATQISSDSAEVEVNYSCIEGWTGGAPGIDGIGSFGRDPLFADPENGDFHLRSEGGRWDADRGRWVHDVATSPCIDAGDPEWPLGAEPLTAPNAPAGTPATNTRINLGVYGGTAEASTGVPG